MLIEPSLGLHPLKAPPYFSGELGECSSENAFLAAASHANMKKLENLKWVPQSPLPCLKFKAWSGARSIVMRSSVISFARHMACSRA